MQGGALQYEAEYANWSPDSDLHKLASESDVGVRVSQGSARGVFEQYPKSRVELDLLETVEAAVVPRVGVEGLEPAIYFCDCQVELCTE